MRSFSIALIALIGTAAANPLEWPRNNYAYKPYPTGGVSSSPTPSPTPTSTPTPSSYPTGGSSSVPHSSHPPPKSSDYPNPPVPTGGSSKPPHPPITYPPTTDTITTYTTETICPVTKTYGTQVITTLTTSTITITSCKGGCHKPTETPTSYPPGVITKTETLTTTTYTFVPCSTSVGHSGPAVIYSTYLTASYYPTTYTTEVLVYPTVAPQPTIVNPYTITTECPAQATVTVTVGAEPCKHCEVKTYTITEHGSKTTFTVTVTPTPQPPTYTPEPPKSTTPHGPKPPVPTGGSSSYTIPSGTSSVPYPTHGPSSEHYSSSRSGPKPTGYHAY